MNLPADETPEDDINLSRARRRRARRQLITTLTPDERTGYLDEVAKRAAPSFDYFLYSALAGVILGIGLLLDSPYLLLAGALVAPLMAPAVGVSLGTILGSWRYFGRSMGGLLVGSVLVLIVSAIIGLFARLWPGMVLLQASYHAQLNWPPLLVTGVCAALTTALIVNDSDRAAIPGVGMAYGQYLPLAAAGFGLGSGIPHLWPDGVVLFLIHLAWITVIGAGTLAVMGFRPLSLFGYSFGGVIALIGILLAIGLGGMGAVATTDLARPTQSPTPSLTPPPSDTPAPPTDTPEPPTSTPSPSLTFTPSNTPTITLTPSATPVQALVDVAGQQGAVLRDEPNGVIVSSLFNGSLVQILGEFQTDTSNQVWARVRDLENDVDGWILQSLLVTATPAPNTATVTPLSSPTVAATATP